MQRIFKNVAVSETPYVFGEPVNGGISESDEAELDSRRRQLEEHIMQSELQIKRQEEEIISEAKTQAAFIIEDAKMQGEQERKKLTENAVIDGLELAARHYCSEYMKLLQYKEELGKRCDHRIQQIEEQVLDIAILLAKKILDIEIVRNDEAIEAAFKNAIERVKDDEKLILELSPENCERVDNITIKGKFKVKANEKFGIDEILLHSEHGTIDATISRQFENLKNELLEKMQ